MHGSSQHLIGVCVQVDEATASTQVPAQWGHEAPPGVQALCGAGRGAAATQTTMLHSPPLRRRTPPATTSCHPPDGTSRPATINSHPLDMAPPPTTAGPRVRRAATVPHDAAALTTTAVDAEAVLRNGEEVSDSQRSDGELSDGEIGHDAALPAACAGLDRAEREPVATEAQAHGGAEHDRAGERGEAVEEGEVVEREAARPGPALPQRSGWRPVTYADLAPLASDYVPPECVSRLYLDSRRVPEVFKGVPTWMICHQRGNRAVRTAAPNRGSCSARLHAVPTHPLRLPAGVCKCIFRFRDPPKATQQPGHQGCVPSHLCSSAHVSICHVVPGAGTGHSHHRHAPCATEPGGTCSTAARHRHGRLRMWLALMAWPGIQGRGRRRPEGALGRMDRGHVLGGSRRAHPELDTMHVRASVRCRTA